MTKPAKHDTPFPFGERLGYMTQFGVVSKAAVGDLSAPIQGYIWEPGYGWVLYAENPWMKDKQEGTDKEKKFPMKMKMSQKLKEKRKPRRSHAD